MLFDAVLGIPTGMHILHLHTHGDGEERIYNEVLISKQ